MQHLPPPARSLINKGTHQLPVPSWNVAPKPVACGSPLGSRSGPLSLPRTQHKHLQPCPASSTTADPLASPPGSLPLASIKHSPLNTAQRSHKVNPPARRLWQCPRADSAQSTRTHCCAAPERGSGSARQSSRQSPKLAQLKRSAPEPSESCRRGRSAASQPPPGLGLGSYAVRVSGACSVLAPAHTASLTGSRPAGHATRGLRQRWLGYWGP